jgi:adenosylcobinamide-phosphate synthase
MDFNHFLFPLLAAFILDTLLGDPIGLPHPIRWFGHSISFIEKRWNKGNKRKLKGALSAIFLIVLTGAVFSGILELAKLNDYSYYIISSLFVFYGLANRSLISEALKVERQLSKYGLDAGRRQLSYIVGRDTTKLDEQQIRTATLETLAENLSDGVIAPLFYYALGGFPLMMSYKMVNTLDSMIGYKSDRYKDFGCFAARFDDLVNYLPARITATLMVVITLSFRGLKFIFKYGHKHSSPNAGYPEAALAGILDCQFGGPNVYYGKVVEKPFIGKNKRPITSKDLYKSVLLNFCTTLVMIGLIILAHWRL